MAVPPAPTGLPRYSVPAECAASSTIGMPFAAANARSGARSSDAPAKCTGTISFVRGVIAAATRSTVVISVSRSTSTNTGVAPRRAMRLTVETQVIDGVMTSSPGPMPSACIRRCMPAVAEVSATACCVPTAAANCRSSSAHYGARRDPAGLEHLRDGRDIRRRDRRPRKRQERQRGRTLSSRWRHDRCGSLGVAAGAATLSMLDLLARQCGRNSHTSQ